MIELFEKGGFLMWPIGLGAVLALAIFLERVYFLRRVGILPERLKKKVRELIEEEKFSEAAVLCEQDRSALATILLTGLKLHNRTRERIREAMSETGKSVAAELERYLSALGTIASVSPLMGLLGTVTGMIGVFQQVTTEGVGDPRILASGIWEALITTAAGMTVAIPAYIGYRHLITRVDRLVLELEESSSESLDLIKRED